MAVAFISAMHGDNSIEIAVVEGDGELINRCAIGHCDETNGTYSVVVVLATRPGAGDLGHYDLAFHIIQTTPDGNYVDYRDGLETAFLDREERQLVKGIICTCVASLIDDLKPSVVIMTTRMPDLPKKALLKYHQIALVFKENGYRSGPADPWNGLHIWMMERS